MVKCESCSSTIGHITLGTKQTGAPSAGNPHAGCDVAGAGNGFTVWLLRHSQRKRGATARLDLRSTAPVLDPTAMATEISFPPAALRSEEALRELSRCLWIAPYLSAFESRPFFRASAPWAIMRSQVG